MEREDLERGAKQERLALEGSLRGKAREESARLRKELKARQRERRRDLEKDQKRRWKASLGSGRSRVDGLHRRERTERAQLQESQIVDRENLLRRHAAAGQR